MKLFKTIIAIVCLFVNVSNAYSTTIPPLERELTLTIKHQRIETILSKIEDITKVKFSYSSDIFSNQTDISIEFKQKTIREALSVLLPTDVVFIAKGNYIILKKKQSKQEKKTTKVTGYVYDAATNKKISRVTIYDKKSLQSATTNDYGYYSFSVPRTNDTVFISKKSYNERGVKIDSINNNSLLTITLNPLSDSILKSDSSYFRTKFQLVGKSTSHFIKNLRGYINSINVKDTINRNFQIAFLPFVGTNHKLSGNVINRVSINVLGGYSRGVKGFELGGLFNINTVDMSGLQISGLINSVSQNVNGVQIAGILNNNLGNAKGVELSGIFNYTKDTLKGVAISGITNITGFNKNSFELTGITNIDKFGNNSLQIAGISNHVLLGTSKLQIAGIYNSAKINKGIQIGLINYADSSSGVSIGLLSFVKKGIHQLELSADELFYTNASFRTGTNKFYNIINIGLNPTKYDDPLWTIGYGIGTSFKVSKSWRSDVSLSINHMNLGSLIVTNSENYKLYWGIEKRLKNKIAVAFGPTLNLYIVDSNDVNYKTKYTNIAPYSFANYSPNSNPFISAWVGAKLAVRLF